MKWLRQRVHEFLCWWKGFDHVTPYHCDQCTGDFLGQALGATSGDWWLCEKCWDKLHEELEAQRANPRTP